MGDVYESGGPAHGRGRLSPTRIAQRCFTPNSSHEACICSESGSATNSMRSPRTVQVGGSLPLPSGGPDLHKKAYSKLTNPCAANCRVAS